MKGKINHYSSILSGKIEYSSSAKNLNSLSGTIKLQKDPKYEEFTKKNVILKGSILTYSDWYVAFYLK
jgi:hypothetical protein